MTVLTAENVRNIVVYCMPCSGEISEDQGRAAIKNGELPEGYQLGEGVVLKVLLNSKRLAQRASEISEMLSQLPDQFHEDKGGGWSFLNACMTKHGEQWGEHRTIDSLVCLGRALGLVDFCLPKDIWPSLPGGMPYFVVKTTSKQVTQT